MREVTIAEFLGQLAAREPTPGGGATAALNAAQGAALLAMVARYSDGARYDGELMGRIVSESDELRKDALTLAEADAAAFGAVSDAYRLPKQTAEEQAARSAAIAEALAGAARPPAGVVRVAQVLVEHGTRRGGRTRPHRDPGRRDRRARRPGGGGGPRGDQPVTRG
jgi:methenyltetrahydrofolate cyclohydrolase